MKDEMNLYKRCKNIFKSHGVDFGGGGTNPDEYRITGRVDAAAGDKGVLIEGTFEGLRDAVIAGKCIVGHAIHVFTENDATYYEDMPVFNCIYADSRPTEINCVSFSIIAQVPCTFRVHSDNTFELLP